MNKKTKPIPHNVRRMNAATERMFDALAEFKRCNDLYAGNVHGVIYTMLRNGDTRCHIKYRKIK